MRAFDKTAAKCFKEWIFTASGGILHSCSGFTLNLTGVTGFSCFFIYRLTSGEERTSDGVIPEPNWDKQQHEEPSISGVATLVWSAVVRRRQIFAPPKRIVADASICSDSLPPPHQNMKNINGGLTKFHEWSHCDRKQNGSLSRDLLHSFFLLMSSFNWHYPQLVEQSSYNKYSAVDSRWERKSRYYENMPWND